MRALWRPRYGKGISGLINDPIVGATRKLARSLEGVQAIYGMGSYFHGATFADLDLVVVVTPSTTPLAALGSVVRATLAPLSTIASAPLDISIFTETEFAARPLRDMHTLVLLFDASDG